MIFHIATGLRSEGTIHGRRRIHEDMAAGVAAMQATKMSKAILSF
jgi:hypothetical protein